MAETLKGNKGNKGNYMIKLLNVVFQLKDSKIEMTYDEALDQRLNVMDTTALVLCRDNDLPMRVMNIFDSGAIMRLMQGEEIGSLIERG